MGDLESLNAPSGFRGHRSSQWAATASATLALPIQGQLELQSGCKNGASHLAFDTPRAPPSPAMEDANTDCVQGYHWACLVLPSEVRL